MPLFDYNCSHCDHTFEKVVQVGSTEPQQCPKCGRLAEQMIPKPAPFQWGGGLPWNS